MLGPLFVWKNDPKQISKNHRFPKEFFGVRYGEKMRPTLDQHREGTDARRVLIDLHSMEQIWVFPKIGVPPKWMVKIMENPIF